MAQATYPGLSPPLSRGTERAAPSPPIWSCTAQSLPRFTRTLRRKILQRLLFVASSGSNFALQNSTRLCGTSPHRPSLRTAGGPDVIGVRCPVVSGLSSPALTHRGGRPARLGKMNLYDRVNFKRAGADKRFSRLFPGEQAVLPHPLS